MFPAACKLAWRQTTPNVLTVTYQQHFLHSRCFASRLKKNLDFMISTNLYTLKSKHFGGFPLNYFAWRSLVAASQPTPNTPGSLPETPANLVPLRPGWSVQQLDRIQARWLSHIWRSKVTSSQCICCDLGKSHLVWKVTSASTKSQWHTGFQQQVRE